MVCPSQQCTPKTLTPPCWYAGFPLTDRDLSRSFAVVSAHAPGEVDWAAHRGIDTLVLLMAGATLRESVGCMLDTGWPESTPVHMLAIMLS